MSIALSRKGFLPKGIAVANIQKYTRTATQNGLITSGLAGASAIARA